MTLALEHHFIAEMPGLDVSIDGVLMPETVVTLRALEGYHSSIGNLVAMRARAVTAENVRAIAGLACDKASRTDFSKIVEPDRAFCLSAECPTTNIAAVETRLFPKDAIDTIVMHDLSLADINDIPTEEFPLPLPPPRKREIRPVDDNSDPSVPIYTEQPLAADEKITARLTKEADDLKLQPPTWLQRRVIRSALRRHVRKSEGYEQALALSALAEQPTGIAWKERTSVYASKLTRKINRYVVEPAATLIRKNSFPKPEELPHNENLLSVDK